MKQPNIKPINNPILAQRLSEGYLTSEEFKQAVKRGLKERLKRNGSLAEK